MPDTPETITPSSNSDLPPGTDMLPARGVSDAPIPPDAMLPPRATAEPQAPPQDTSQIQNMAPSEPPPAETHLQALGDILGKVAGIITGDEKWVVTRDADGNAHAERARMGTGEKWGRIAAAALGGAARGMAAGQGPGGMGKAIGAGFQGGMQDQMQQKQSAFSEADQENRELVFKANRASLLQDVVRKTMDNKFAGTKASLDELEMTQKMHDRLAAAPGATDAGIRSTLKEIYDIPYTHPELMKGHTDATVEAYPVYNPDHTIKGWQGYIVDKAWADQKTKDDRYFYEWKPNPDDPVNGAPILEKRLVKAGQTTEGAYANGMLSVVNQGLDYQKKRADAAKAAQPQKISNYQEAYDAARRETDPAKKAELTNLANDLYNKALKIKGTKAGGGTGSGTSSGLGRGAVGGGTTPQERDTFLATLSPADRATVKQIGEVRGAAPSRVSKEGQRIMGLVNQAYPDYDASKFPIYQQTKKDFTTGKAAVGLNFINTARNHIARMEKNIDGLENLSIPYGVGSFLNAVKNAAKKSTDPRISTFLVDKKAVSDEVAKAYTGGAITDQERNHMNELIDASDSPEVIRANIMEFKNLLDGKVDSYRDQWNSGMPSGSPINVLDRVSDGKFQSIGLPDVIGGKPQSAQPAGSTPQPIIVTDPTGKQHPFNTQAEADAFKRLAKIQ